MKSPFIDALSKDELLDRLDLALEGAGLGIWDWDLGDDSVQFDRRWCEMLGLPHESTPMVLETWASRVHPDDIEQCFADIRAHVAGQTSRYQNLHRMRHSDGTWRYILDRGRISGRDASGKALRMTGTHLDVTASEHDRQTLAAQQKQLLQLVRQMPVPLAMVDAEMRYLAASGRWVSDYGLEGQVLEGRSHYEVFPTIPGRWKEIHRYALAGQTLSAAEDRFEREDGRVQWISWDVRPWLDAEGRTGGILMRSEDVTAQVERRMRHEGELRLAAVGLVAGGIAHEINTPLQVVSIEQEYVREELGREAPDLVGLRESTTIAHRALERIVAIVQATRNLMRPEREDAPELVSAETVLEDAKLLCGARFAAPGVELALAEHTSGATVRGHRAEIGQIVVNLLNNALDATSGREGARAELSVSVEGPMLVLCVTDNGTGIAEGDSARLMEPFFSTKPPGQGTGLGLSISHALASRQGGSLRLTSRANPTTFELRLPLAASPSERPRE